MQCSRCQSQYDRFKKRPLILPCGHTFCEACLKVVEDFVRDEMTNNKKCFNCKRMWTNVLMKNLTVVSDLIPTIGHVQADPYPQQRNAIAKRDHEPDVNVCNIHRRPLIYWCQNCTTLCCALCSSADHKGCATESLKDTVLPNLKKECSSAIKSMMEQHDKINKTLSNTCQALEDIRLYKASLEALEMDLEVYRAKVGSLQMGMGKFVGEMKQCLKELTEGGDSLGVLQKKSKILCKYTDLNVDLPTSPPLPSVLLADALKTGKMDYPDPKRTKFQFPDTLEGFGYKFKEGKMRNILTDEPFKFVVKENDQAYNQRHYEALGEVVTEEVYRLLESECGLVRLPVPCDEDPRGGKGFIFASQNWNTSERLMIFINGSGVVRAGQWSRRLIINDSLDSGSQIPFIKRALLIGFDVIVLNTNQRVAPDAKGNLAPVKVSSTPSSHAIYAWENYVQMAAAEHIAIVAHSYGGVVTTDLYRQFKFEEFEKKVFAIAFTDSVHFLNSGIEFGGLIDVARNWVSSDKPVDTPLSAYGEGRDVQRVSAGVNVHEKTSWSSFRSVFNFFHERLQDKLNVPLPEIPFDEVPPVVESPQLKKTTTTSKQQSEGRDEQKNPKKSQFASHSGSSVLSGKSPLVGKLSNSSQTSSADGIRDYDSNAYKKHPASKNDVDAYKKHPVSKNDDDAYKKHPASKNDVDCGDLINLSDKGPIATGNSKYEMSEDEDGIFNDSEETKAFQKNYEKKQRDKLYPDLPQDITEAPPKRAFSAKVTPSDVRGASSENVAGKSRTAASPNFFESFNKRTSARMSTQTHGGLSNQPAIKPDNSTPVDQNIPTEGISSRTSSLGVQDHQSYDVEPMDCTDATLSSENYGSDFSIVDEDGTLREYNPKNSHLHNPKYSHLHNPKNSHLHNSKNYNDGVPAKPSELPAGARKGHRKEGIFGANDEGEVKSEEDGCNNSMKHLNGSASQERDW